MRYLIATDEAGYGPNLGPLVVSATVWRVPEQVDHFGLYEALAQVVSPDRNDPEDSRLCIADSKQLYRPGGGLAMIERGCLATLQPLGCEVEPSWKCLWKLLCPQDEPEICDLPWYEEFDCWLPMDANPLEIQRASKDWATGAKRAKIELLGIQSRTIFARSFNRLLLEHGNKSSVLSWVTIQLIRDQMQKFEDGEILVLCDKHGGRNRYGALLQHIFDDAFVEVRGESRARSLYRFGPPHRRVEFCFQAKADRVLAAGLASMVSKYLREIAMRAFNDFWCREHAAELRPTAGYPVDARRFKKQIAATQSGLGISDEMLWRQK